MPFFTARLCTLQAAKDILCWKGNHVSSPDRVNQTAVQSLAVCHVTVPASVLYSLYWWESKAINRVLVSFPYWATTQTPSSALVRPPQISLLSHLKTQKEKVKKRKQLARSSLFFSRLGGKKDQAPFIWWQNKRVISKSLALVTVHDLPGLKFQLNALVNRWLLGPRPNSRIDRVSFYSNCSPNDAVTADDSCADIKTSSCLGSMHKD